VIIMILTMVVLFAIEWLLRRIFRTGAHTRGLVGRKRRRARKQTEQAAEAGGRRLSAG
jgi:HemY protein